MAVHAEFDVHKLNKQGLANARAIADAFDNFLSQLSLLCPAGRHLSIVRTKLEEACFFAKKSMAIDLANQEAPQEAQYTLAE